MHHGPSLPNTRECNLPGLLSATKFAYAPAPDPGMHLAGRGVTFQLNGTASTSASGVTNVASLGVYVDRRNAPPPTNTTYGGGFDGGPVTLPSGSTPGNNLHLRTLIDNSLFEVSDTLTLYHGNADRPQRSQ